MSQKINFEPVIKWSGSKRSQMNEIIRRFPTKIKTYYEPFVGGGSMTRMLIESGIQVDNIVCSDLNDGLINLWNAIKDRPEDVISHYGKLWNEMNSTDDRGAKRSYFEEVRKRYNTSHDPLDFMFIMRTTTNGMPRYNRTGDFNNSYHITRDGIQPASLAKIVEDWSGLLKKNDVSFICRDYRDVKPEHGDFVYLDPPYANTKGMYFGGFDVKKLFDWMGQLECGYALSFDGKSGDVDNTFDVPNYLYDKHEYLCSGNSSFKRTIGKSNDSIVYESLYVKY